MAIKFSIAVALAIVCTFVLVLVLAPLSALAHKHDLSGKTVVITGASSGFGKGVAIKLAAAGANVVLAARRADLLEALARECGAHALAVPTDVTSDTSVEALCKAAIEKFGRIDVWINNAGVGAVGRFTDIPPADHKAVVEINLVGTINGSYYALRHFRQVGSGTLVNISSISGKAATGFYSSYSAAKFGVRGLGRALRAELHADGVKDIHICTVMPMPASTPFWIHAANYTGHILKPYPVCPAAAVVDVIVEMVSEPKDEMSVGGTTKKAFAALKLAPSFTENKMAEIIRERQMESGALAVPTSGSLFKPMDSGTEISE